jgi:hypothetical protein
LRDELFLGHHPQNAWTIIDTFLYTIEQQSQKILEDDDRRYIKGLTEEQFIYFYQGQSTNTHKQANAIAALRAIEVIRSLTHVFDNHGYLMCDPHANHAYDSLTVAKLILETITLIAAPVRGESWEDHWPKLDRGRRRIAKINQTKKAAATVWRQRVFENLANAQQKMSALMLRRIFKIRYPGKVPHARTLQRYMREHRKLNGRS